MNKNFSIFLSQVVYFVLSIILLVVLTRLFPNWYNFLGSNISVILFLGTAGFILFLLHVWILYRRLTRMNP